MHKFPRYKQYRDSGFPWLGEIPEHWQTRRNRFLFREVDKRSTHGEETHLSMSQIHGLVPSKSLNRKSLQSETYAGGKLVEEHDLVLNRLKAHLGVFARAKQTGVVSPDYTVLRPKREVAVQYCELLFKTPIYVAEFRRRTKGIVEGFWRLYTNDFYNVSALLPPPEEQNQIVAYLQAQDAHIARFIKVKRNLIALMAEQRGVLTERAISSAATQRIRFDRVVTLLSNPITRNPKKVYKPIGMFNRGRGIFHKPLTEGKHLGDSSFFQIKKGDLIFSGQFAWEGAVAVAGAEDDGCIASHRYPITKCMLESVTPEYLYSFFLSKEGDLILNHHSRGAAGRNRPLNPRSLLKEKIPVPPMNLQREITDFFIKEQLMRCEVEKEIALIREYRARLIADVVTGKVDVRNWVPNPDDMITEEDLVALCDDEEIDTDLENENDDD